MKKKFILGDMSKVLIGLEGKWVALSMKNKQIVVSGTGDTISEAIEKARQKGVDDPTLMRVPEEFCSYIL
jgi:malonyl CoA-acyl carrier protein transacylase